MENDGERKERLDVGVAGLELPSHTIGDSVFP